MFYERNSVSRIPGPVFFPGFGGGAVGLEAGATFLTEGGVRGVVVPAVAAAEHAGGGAVYFAAVFGLFDSLLLLFPLLPLEHDARAAAVVWDLVEPVADGLHAAAGNGGCFLDGDDCFLRVH